MIPETQYQIDGIVPNRIERPNSESDLQQILLAETPRQLVLAGNGSKLGMGNRPEKVDLLLSVARLNGVIEYVPDDLTVTVEAGMIFSDLQNLVAEQEQFVPLDPPHSRNATVGGIVATNSSGSLRHQYGATRDLVLGLRVFLADGTAIKSGGKVVKNVAGYDLNKLFVGSFGTLGVISQVCFKLYPKPETERTILLTFDSAKDAVAFGREIRATQLLPAFLNLSLNGLPTTEIVQPCLLVGIDGSAETVSWQIDQISQMTKHKTASLSTCSDEQGKNLRLAVRDFPVNPNRSSNRLVCRVNLRPSDLPNFIDTVLESVDVPPQIMALIGKGVIHLAFSHPNDHPTGLVDTIQNLRAQVVANRGNLVIELAPVEVKEQIDVWGEVGSTLGLMRQIKSELDPNYRLNPNRFVGQI